MPGDDLLIGNDGDYVDDGQGGFTLTTTAQPSVRHQLLDRLGDWIGDPEAGREIRGNRGRNASATEMDAERDSHQRALEVLQNEDLIDNIEIEVDRDQLNRFALQTRTRDTQSGGTIEFSTLNEFGG